LTLEYNVNDFAELNGVLYLAADEGMLSFSNDKFELMVIDTAAPNSIRAILNIEDTSLFCATRNGLFRFNGSDFSVYEDEKLEGLNMSDIARRDNELFISTYYAGLICLDLNSSVISTIPTPVNRIRNIHVTKDAILCATKNGATEIGEHSLFHYNLQNGLIFENIRSVFIDREQNIWLGTDGKGLLKLTGKSIISYTKG
jgi:ligand-binding sensor domain-containing protein